MFFALKIFRIFADTHTRRTPNVSKEAGMEIGTNVYEAAGSAPLIARDGERKDDALRQEQNVGRDTVNISDAARQLLRMQEGGESSGNPSSRDGGGRQPFHGKQSPF